MPLHETTTASPKHVSYWRVAGKLMLSFMTVFVACVAIMCRVESLPLQLGLLPAVSPLTDADVRQFHQDGFLVYRNLLQPGAGLQALQQAGRDITSSFFWTDLLFGKLFHKVRLQTWRSKRVIAQLAFQSSLPSMAAQLLGEQSSIRILKDALFGQVPNKPGCGFHVDDKGFWPARDDSNGVNFWIALSSYTKVEGGGIRVAKGSHKQDWARACRDIIYAKTEDTKKPMTCSMPEWSPDCNERLENISITFDLEPGDVVMWDRWTFHKSDPFHGTNNGTEAKLRYTIRYIPSDAVAEGMHHGSVKDGELYHGHYYPQVWPMPLEEELKKLRGGFGWSIKDRLLPFF
jgi:hypothetical protein